MDAVRWIGSGLLLALFLWLALLNGWVAWSIHVTRKPSRSWVPLLGGAFGAFGLASLPVAGAAGPWWIPFLLDWGCAPGLVHALVWHALRRSRRS